MRGHDRQHRQAPSPGDGGRRDARDSPDRAQALQRAAGNQAMAGLVRGETPLVAREELERAYDVDLGRVRVHTGPEAVAAARAQNALAFTRGDDVFLGGGGPHVIEHELAHVLQQAGGRRTSPRLSTDALEQQAGRGSEVTVGAAPHGAVQRWEWPWEEEEKKEIDPAAKQRLVDELSVDKSAWKRHLDDPVSAEILRTHSQIQLSYADDAEFKAWMRDPTYRPQGSPPKQAAGAWSQASEAKRSERAAADAAAEAQEKAEAELAKRGIQPTPPEGSIPVAKPVAEEDWATAQNRMTLKQRAKAAYQTGTGAKKKRETERHGPLGMYMGALEKSLQGFEQGIKSVPFVRAAVPIVQTVAGEDILGREKSRWSAAGEAISDIVLDFGSLLAPEDLIALGGEGKVAGTAEQGLAGTTAELEANIAQHGVSPGVEVAPIEEVLEHTAPPVGIAPEAEAGAKTLGESTGATASEVAPTKVGAPEGAAPQTSAETAAKATSEAPPKGAAPGPGGTAATKPKLGEVTVPTAPASPPGTALSSQPTADAVKIAETTETTRVIEEKYKHLGLRDISDLSKPTNAPGPDRVFVLGSGDDIALLEVDAKLSIQGDPVVISGVSSFETQAATGGAGRLKLLDTARANGVITQAEFDTLKGAVQSGLTQEEVVGVGAVKAISKDLQAQGVTYTQGEQFAEISERAAAQQQHAAELELRETISRPATDKRTGRSIAKEIWDEFTKVFPQ